MSRDHDSADAEKGDLQHDLEKTEDESTDEHSDLSLPTGPQTVLTKGSDPLTATGPPDATSVDVDQRGRRVSAYSHSSDDTQNTVSDDAHHPHDHQLPSRTRSRAVSRARSSVRSVRPDAVKVPKAQRRGLLARFCLIDEVTNAWDYPRKMKWIITTIVAIAGAAAPMGSSIVLPALVDITREFHSTATVANLSVAMYMLSMSIFPLWWSSFSETLGRRTIYVVSFALFLVFNVLAAVSVNMAMFIVMRLLSGGAAASVQAVGAGTIADVWEVKERGKAMGMFYLGPLCGPLLSPILGGVFAQTLGWRSAQWFLAIFGVCLFIFIVFALPETLRERKNLGAEVEQAVVESTAEATNEKGNARPGLARVTTAKSVHVKTKKYLLMARRIFIDPLAIILHLRSPAVAVLVGYATVTFAALYILNISVQSTFSAPPYNYDSIIIGCLYLPNSAGYFLASVFGGRWVDQIMHREARKAGRYDARGKLIFIPEDRMKENAWLGAILYPASLVAYGWFARYHINVAAALVANFFFGIGSMLIFALVTTMLTEFMPKKASSGVALNNFFRNIFSCVGVIVAEPLIVAIGNGWLFTGLAVIALGTGCLTTWMVAWLVRRRRRIEMSPEQAESP